MYGFTHTTRDFLAHEGAIFLIGFGKINRFRDADFENLPRGILFSKVFHV